MDDTELQASPRKRLKAEHLTLDGSMDDSGATFNEPMPDAPPTAEDGPDTRLSKEAECGITEFISPDLPGFTGVLKKRYTDFLVNEILPSGEVVHLDNLKGPKRKTLADDVSATKHEPSGTKSVARPDPVDPPLRSDEKALQQPTNLEPQTSDGSLDDIPVVQQTTEELAHHRDPSAKIPPHQRIPEVAPSGEQKTHVSAEPQLGEAGTPSRRKEKTILRQTSSGLVEVEQNLTNVPQKANSEDTDASQRKENEAPQTRSHESVSTSTADWQSYANPSSGFQLSSEDGELLASYFHAEVVDSIVSLYSRVLNSPHRSAKEHGVVTSAVIDRETRTKIHQAVRRIFGSRLETTTGDDGTMIISAATPVGAGRSGWNTRNHTGGGGRGAGRGGGSDGRSDGARRPQQKGKPGWQDLGGEYLHFSLLKENKDTMEVISYLARSLKSKPQSFQFAGTKDRRGVTVQRVSVYRVLAERMIAAGRTLRNAKVGNYAYQPSGLQLGELTGNEFTVTLRDCQFGLSAELEGREQSKRASEIVGTAIKNLNESGFINYYGLQRFGTFSTRTDDVGIKMLQGNFEGAVKAILDYSPTSLAAAQDPMSGNDRVSRDDKARAHAIHTFQTTGRSHPAVDEMPKKFSAETNIIRFLGNPDNKNNYLGSLQMISRNLRLMYVHAYQSLVWNVAASERWKRFGNRVIEGDLVLVDEHKDKVEGATKPAEEVDADGEAVVQPDINDRAATTDEFFTRARALTKEEADSGKYTIFEIVLPTPGYDILYPANEMAAFYKDFMASPRGGGLDPHDMRRPWRDISLSGSYRKLLARPGKDISYEIKEYTNEDEQFVQTDLDRLARNANGQESNKMDAPPPPDGQPGAVVEEAAAPKKLAVVLKLQLGSSQYATMALRELMKSGGVRTFKMDYGGGR